MWAMLRTSLTYDGFSKADGLYVTSTVPIDLAAMLRDWPGLTVTDRQDHQQFGVCWMVVEGVHAERDKTPPPPPLAPDRTVPWNAVQLFVLQCLGMDGWEPYAYGPSTSAGWPIHLLRKRLDHHSARGG